MRTIKLQRLEIANFKSIAALTLDTGMGNVNVYGTNASGKSTLYDAFLWLLFGKNGDGRSDFEVKPLDKNGEVKNHGAVTTVAGVFDVDGATVELRREYAEKWTRKRGQAAEEFSGHTTSYYVDSVPVKKTEYESKINDLIPEEILRLVTNPRYFNEGLDWKKRRETLLQMGGDDIPLTALLDDGNRDMLSALEKYGLEDLKKMRIAERAKLNKKLEELPTRIDEAQLTLLPDDDNRLSRDQLTALLADQQNQKKEAESRLSETRNPLENKINIVRQKLRLLSAEKTQTEKRLENRKNNRVVEARRTMERATTAVTELVTRENVYTEEIENCNRQLDALRATWKSKKNEQWNGETVCMYCGQTLPAGKIREVQEKFAQNQKKELQEIQDKALQIKSALAKWENGAQEIKLQLEKAREALGLLQSPNCEKSPEDTQEENNINQLSEQINAKTTELDALMSNSPDNDQQEALKKEIEILTQKINANQKKIMALGLNEERKNRIVELHDEMRATTVQLENVERELCICEDLTRKKCDLIEHNINNMFRLTKFRLFKNQINGGLADTCIATVNGVPYPDVNSAGKLLCGLDIIGALSQFCGIQAPIFIDNAESVVGELDNTQSQVIRLIVSADDQKLRFEKGE